MEAAPPSARLEAGRRLWLTLHRYIGLVVGALFVLIGLTGSVLAFWQDLDEWFNPGLMTVAVPEEAGFRPLGEILAAADAVRPQGGKPVILKMPGHPGGAAVVGYGVSVPELGMDFHTVFVDPYTATVTGRRVHHAGDELAQPLIYVLMSLHSTLLLGRDKGAAVVGIPAIFLMTSVIAGLYLWWPRNGKWRQALTVKPRAGAERRVYDLHKVFGVYFALVLIVLLFSGIYMLFKPQVQALVELFSPVRQMPMDLKSEAAAGRGALGPDAVVAIADRIFRDGTLHSITFPQGSDGVWLVGKRADDEPNHADTKRIVAIDQYSGKVLHVQDPRAFTAGETFLEWQYPLHSGEAFGNFGRSVILFMGFVPLILYVTGVIRWLQKRRAKRRRVVSRGRGAASPLRENFTGAVRRIGSPGISGGGGGKGAVRSIRANSSPSGRSEPELRSMRAVRTSPSRSRAEGGMHGTSPGAAAAPCADDA